MADFMIRFLLCNMIVIGMTGLLFILRLLLKNCLSPRLQYNLWLILLGLLAVPFIPLRPLSFSRIFLWLKNLSFSPSFASTGIVKTYSDGVAADGGFINDLALSVDAKTSSAAGLLLFGIWILGILVMTILTVRSALYLRMLKKSALPLQNPDVYSLYVQCLKEAGIRKPIPVYSTAFLKSPVMTGLFDPCVFLPISLISDCTGSELRYILLHELQHYKYKDAFANLFMNLAGILYWFNPVIRPALKEMRGDRELACDTSVLKLLREEEYADYGNTLISFAEKLSLLPFTSGLGESGEQIKRRIINIASYERPTFFKKLKSRTAFTLVLILLLGLSPALSTYGAQKEHYLWKDFSGNITYVDLSSYFGEYEGSFVLYDLENDAFSIYDMEHAALRVSPDSTYKIYDALFGLEEGIITPGDSFIPWDGETYPFEAWNSDQTLESAMRSSVNWYFQALDERLTNSLIYRYIHKIGYGNENIRGGFPSYWMESSLKISPIEQVELLIKLQNNGFGFSPENTRAVKDSICIASLEAGKFYGKTGTGRVDEKDVNGWFIGYIETADNTWFFAANIGSHKDANGSNAAGITLSVLSDMGIWKDEHSLPVHD